MMLWHNSLVLKISRPGPLLNAPPAAVQQHTPISEIGNAQPTLHTSMYAVLQVHCLLVQ